MLVKRSEIIEKSKVLKIDGSTGEGGGQIIRTALTLSMLTTMPIEVTNIRAGRSKPGLMRQHLMCVQASQRIANATVTGDHLGSTAFSFTPNEIQSGDYTLDIGSAGSTSLVLQTLLPALLFTDTTSTLTIKGGTHNPMAPTADFLIHAYLPVLAKLGVQVDYSVSQTGYAPVGGGEIAVTIAPFQRLASALPFELITRGKLLSINLHANHLNLDKSICQRELSQAKDRLIKAGVNESLIKTYYQKQLGIGEGNSCYAIVNHAINNAEGAQTLQVHQEVFTLLGEKRTSAEKVGNRLAGLVKRYLFKTDALVDVHLTDQLLLPLALSGGGEFTARLISEHSETQAWMIEQFLPVSIQFKALNSSNYIVKVEYS